MKKRKKVGTVLILLCMMCASALFLSGCTTFDNFKATFIDKKTKTSDTIKIGVYEPMTGSDSEGGLEEIDGITLANKLRPTVLGKKVELVFADNKSDLDAAETGIVDLIKKKPLAVLGSYGNIYSLAANQYLEAAEIPGIAITNTNPLVTGNNPYYFRVCFAESYQAEALAKYAFGRLGQRRTAVMVPEDDDQAAVMAYAYRDKFGELTKDPDSLAAYETYTPGEKNFLNHLKALGRSKAKTVFLAGATADVCRILQQAGRMNLNLTFLGDSTWGSKEFINAAGGHRSAGKIAFSHLYNTQEAVTETSQKFLNAYEWEYGNKKDADARTSAALGFDAYLLALQAIEKAGAGCTGTEVRDMLAATKNFQGASGEITFTKSGDPRKSVVISTIAKGKTVPICTIDPFEKKGSKKSQKKNTQEDNNNGTEN